MSNDSNSPQADDQTTDADVPVIAIGASAGGLDPLREFLQSLSPPFAASIVILSHRAATGQSALAELLNKASPIPVADASEGAALLPGHALLIPAAKAVSFHNGRIHLRDIQARERFSPIDQLFRELAKMGDAAIAIVLSGSGNDGSVGVKDIKAAGGVVLVQDPATARYPGMPEATIASVTPDHVLPPMELGPKAMRLAGLLKQLDHHPEPRQPGKRFVERVLGALLDVTGHDFTSYKRSTVTRRIQRRMHVLDVKDSEEYMKLVHERPAELELLFSELLIGVTSFFRDPDSFQAFEAAIARYIEKLEPSADLRIWVPACSTGEEAYSIAIVVHECLERLNKHPTVQIFATDLDPRSIQTARTGRYSAAVAADISPGRLERYFVAEDSTVRVAKEIRELLIFAPQDLIRDPPFTRVDVLSCRNMLIYLEPDLQQKILSLFHYALCPGGILFLGTAETLGSLDDAFSVFDKKNKLFINCDAQRSHRLSTLQLELPIRRSFEHQEEEHPAPHRRASVRGIGVIADRILLSQLVPPSVLITQRGEIAYIHGRTGRFLEPAAGEPNANVFDMAREGLRLELPAAIREAAHRQLPIVRHDLQVRTNGGFEQVTLKVQPLHEPDAVTGLLLVTFDSKGPIENPMPGAARTSGGEGAPTDRAAQLEAELQHVRENLQGTIEELETSNEELKSTNEELQSTNEELQSTNEELETSREEMQSLNEELQTLNAELQDRNEELSQINDDMQNLLNGTDVATVFLDGSLNIKRFTAPAKKVFHLRDTDLGRPLSDMAANVRYDRLIEDAQQVLRSLVFAEREVQMAEGDWRLMRILPYRTAQNVIDGLIITFLGIDRFKRAEQQADRARTFAEKVINSLSEGLLVLSLERRIVDVNPAFCQIFSVAKKAIVGETLEALGPGWNHPEVTRRLDDLANQLRFEPLRLRGPFDREVLDVIISGFDLDDAANGAHFVLVVRNLNDGVYPDPVELAQSQTRSGPSKS